VKNLPSNIAVLIILGLALVIIGVLAALHVAIPDVVSTVALVAAGGGAGLSLPAVQAISYNPTPAPVAPVVPAPPFAVAAPVAAPQPFDSFVAGTPVAPATAPVAPVSVGVIAP
jgi:hypothetical protein